MSASLEVGSFFRTLTKELRKASSSKALEDLGEFAVENIVTRTRLGYGVRSMGAKRQKLKPLSSSYVRHRQENRRELSRFTRPGRSNLTFTGQMLASMRVTRASFGVVKLGPSGRRSDGQRNSTILIENEKRGRFYNFLSDLELKKIQRFYEQSLKKKLKG